MPNTPDPTAIQPIANTTASAANELQHVTEEMYKKNFELAEKNKTLSLLRKLDETIAGAVTDVKQIAQQVADDVATEAEFQGVAIYLYDKEKNALDRLAFSQTKVLKDLQEKLGQNVYRERVPLDISDSPFTKVLQEKKGYAVHDFATLLDKQGIDKKITTDTIKASFLYPLVARNEVIGLLVININDNESSLFQYQKDLIGRLVEIIGIAIDNALLYQSIQEANERLKGLDKLKDEFVSLASHELRTPLTAIKSYLWMVLAQDKDMGSLSEKQHKYLDRTYKASEELLALVGDMLDVSRIESGRMTITKSPVDMVALATDVVSQVMATAQIKHLQLSVQQQALQPVIADSSRIREVLTNLLGNSLKFTPENGSITISFIEKDNMLWTSVADTGKGIKSSDVGKLFEKFGMIAGNYLTRDTSQGTGLGLYICKKIVELHGGTIIVASKGENHGATFTFSLPLA